LGAQFALGPCDAPGCRRCEAASQPSLLALPQRSVTRARYRGAVITAGTPEFRRPPQTRLASWHATHATSSVLPPLPTNVHPSHARQKHAPHRLRSTKNRCAEQGHTLRATRRHPPALIVFPLKTLASRPPAPGALLPRPTAWLLGLSRRASFQRSLGRTDCPAARWARGGMDRRSFGSNMRR